MGNFLTALETILNDMQVKGPWHRQRLKYIATPVEVAIKAEGLRSLREAKLSDIPAINRYNKRSYTRLQQKFIDRAVVALRTGDAKGLVRAITRAAKYGVIIDDKALERELLQKVLPQEVRTFLMTRRVRRGEPVELLDFVNRK